MFVAWSAMRQVAVARNSDALFDRSGARHRRRKSE
jgi:hypothetical protein